MNISELTWSEIWSYLKLNQDWPHQNITHVGTKEQLVSQAIKTFLFISEWYQGLSDLLTCICLQQLVSYSFVATWSPVFIQQVSKKRKVMKYRFLWMKVICFMTFDVPLQIKESIPRSNLNFQWSCQIIFQINIPNQYVLYFNVCFFFF